MAQYNDSVKNPFEYLRQDHRALQALLERLVTLSQSEIREKAQVFQAFFNGLVLHSAVEDQVLYPVLEELNNTEGLVDESFVEHQVIHRLLEEIDASPPESETWSAKLKVLQENLEHHIQEEEQPQGMFAKAEASLDSEKQQHLGDEMQMFLSSHSPATV